MWNIRTSGNWVVPKVELFFTKPHLWSRSPWSGCTREAISSRLCGGWLKQPRLQAVSPGAPFHSEVTFWPRLKSFDFQHLLSRHSPIPCYDNSFCPVRTLLWGFKLIHWCWVNSSVKLQDGAPSLRTSTQTLGISYTPPAHPGPGRPSRAQWRSLNKLVRCWKQH